ncbi:MAG: helix-turn-helix domain-containing protein [Saprospiraceae bacterium]
MFEIGRAGDALNASRCKKMTTVSLRKAINLLQSTEMSIMDILWATGFNAPSYFARMFQEEIGKTPKALRN